MAGRNQQQSTIPDYVDEAARSSPRDTWAIVPRSTIGLDDGWHHFSYSDLARAVDSLAWWIEKNVGPAQYQGQTIGYMGCVIHHPDYMNLLTFKTVQTTCDT
jgi:acyl-CoA synthetase (AMP-forming)/AMP-acid ligase II